MTRARATADTQDNNGGSVPPFVGAKNRILNGDFAIWQRGTSFTITANNGYTADRFLADSDGTLTISRQSFTAGAAPVAGYESPFFLRVVKSGGTYASIVQRIEDVRTFAGQTVTFSFWAKCSTGTVSWQPVLVQNFGSGGSASVDTYASSITINTTWTRYSVTVSVPSISGRTIGTNSFLTAVVWFAGSGAQTVDLWGVQLEAGSVATPFTTATGTIQGELAACQRYYWKTYNQATAPGTGTYLGARYLGAGLQGTTTTTQIISSVSFPTMRATPTVTAYDPSGNINRCTRVAPGVNEYPNEAITIDELGQTGARVYSSSGTAAGSFIAHFVVSAEL